MKREMQEQERQTAECHHATNNRLPPVSDRPRSRASTFFPTLSLAYLDPPGRFYIKLRTEGKDEDRQA